MLVSATNVGAAGKDVTTMEKQPSRWFRFAQKGRDSAAHIHHLNYLRLFMAVSKIRGTSHALIIKPLIWWAKFSIHLMHSLSR